MKLLSRSILRQISNMRLFGKTVDNHKKLQLRCLTGFWMSFWVLCWVAPSHSSCTPSPIFYRKLFGVIILALSIFTTFLFCSKVHFLRYLITRYMYNILSISSEKYSWENVSSDYINWLYVLVMSRTSFQSEFTLSSCLNVKELLAKSGEAGAKSEGEVTGTGLEPRTT